MCDLLHFGVGPENGKTFVWSDTSNPNLQFVIGVRIVGAVYVEWYVWLPLSLIALIGLACLIWPMIERLKHVHRHYSSNVFGRKRQAPGP
jgi:hypothetical protein